MKLNFMLHFERS